jgi:hypothetical protein
MGDATRNVEVLKDAHQRWANSKGGSVDHWMTIVSDDIQFGSLARGAPEMRFATSYDNRSLLRDYFEGLLTGWDMIHYTVDEFVADGCAVRARGATR